ncbi:MAG: prephenate dehydrogenase/arogenate dehydrogenase family protein [Candidatus Eremiobacteraeota bacterium]|nr:prephenate dehydrogenase/arogenate dehydrogenase family protein [Candidatus Eremiobacteraeota bacterium]MBV8498260.1 prephenate dehydrogenase/arogenate dehydrogenase family protein [Candidatus Eremiobacteraeota bacterium]
MIGSVLGIFGVGMMGGSVGLHARARGVYVVGCDIDPAALDAAAEAGAIDAAATPETLAGEADVLVVASHLEPTLCELERLSRGTAVRAELVLDVASVKVPVVSAAERLKNFVATHPMAGCERSGAGAARADLFAGCSWAYVPSGDAGLDARALEFIRWCGGIPVATSAEAHDRIVALTSHLPQIVASCYAALLGESESEAQRLSGPVARELLRISDMNAPMWRDILRANAHYVEPQLRRLANALAAAADGLEISTGGIARAAL